MSLVKLRSLIYFSVKMKSNSKKLVKAQSTFIEESLGKHE